MQYSGYNLSQLKPLVATIFECCLRARNHHAAVYEKYSNLKYKRTSAFVETAINKGFTLSFLPPLCKGIRGSRRLAVGLRGRIFWDY